MGFQEGWQHSCDGRFAVAQQLRRRLLSRFYGYTNIKTSGDAPRVACLRGLEVATRELGDFVRKSPKERTLKSVCLTTLSRNTVFATFSRSDRSFDWSNNGAKRAHRRTMWSETKSERKAKKRTKRKRSRGSSTERMGGSIPTTPPLAFQRAEWMIALGTHDAPSPSLFFSKIGSAASLQDNNQYRSANGKTIRVGVGGDSPSTQLAHDLKSRSKIWEKTGVMSCHSGQAEGHLMIEIQLSYEVTRLFEMPGDFSTTLHDT
ncbi:hypothetical protein Syun_010378 [Stephania yunnanensis]|uniref:Uncharacterized protein n=1 Tax=Stephania yunnanensis TaxID=152371 RepID=A0AAP0KII2_9MAGN